LLVVLLLPPPTCLYFLSSASINFISLKEKY
jgi:hypothetical protein